jgi:hypothetical protein
MFKDAGSEMHFFAVAAPVAFTSKSVAPRGLEQQDNVWLSIGSYGLRNLARLWGKATASFTDNKGHKCDNIKKHFEVSRALVYIYGRQSFCNCDLKLKRNFCTRHVKFRKF